MTGRMFVMSPHVHYLDLRGGVILVGYMMTELFLLYLIPIFKSFSCYVRYFTHHFIGKEMGCHSPFWLDIKIIRYYLNLLFFSTEDNIFTGESHNGEICNATVGQVKTDT